MPTKAEALAQIKKQQADAAYLRAVIPNFAQTGFALGDPSKFKTVNPGADPYAVADEYGNIPDNSYQEDEFGQRIAFSPYQGVDNDGNPQGGPEYRQLTNIDGKQVQVFYDDKGNFKNAIGDDITVSGHKYTPIYDQRGNIIKYEDAGGDGFADFAKMVAITALTSGLGGAAGVGNSLYGLSGTAGQIAGGATLGAGRAAITGGNILQGALSGGLGGAGSLQIPGVDFTVGDFLKGLKAVDAISRGNILGAFSSIASMSGVGGIKVGDTGFTINELARDANILNAVIKGNPAALLSTITAINNASSNRTFSKEDYDNLSPELQAIYNTQGLAGIKEYIKQQELENTTPPPIEQPPVEQPPPPVEQPPVEQPPPPVEQPSPPPGGLPSVPTVAVTGALPTAPIVDLTPTVTPPLTTPTPVTPPIVTPPPLATVAVTAPKCDPGFHYDEELKQCVPDEAALPPVNPNPPTGTPGPVTPPPLATVAVTAPKCDPGFHYDEIAKACVPDEAALPPVAASTSTPPVVPKDPVIVTGKKDTCPVGTHYDPTVDACVPNIVDVSNPVTTTSTPPVNSTPPVVPKDPVVITGKRDPCPPGTHYDEKLDACVPDEIVVTAKRDPCPAGTHYDEKLDACVPDEPAKPPVKPPVPTTPTAPTSGTKTTTTARSPTTKYFDPVLDTSPQFLAGKYVPTKELSKLASLHQIFDSLHPDMKALMAERNIAPPPLPMEDLAQKQDTEMTPEEQIKANQTVFSASGGLISSETQKMIDSLTPKFASAPTFLAGAPVSQHQSPLGSLKHLAQGPLKGPKLGSGMAHGGLPHKYAEAAPRGHNPEFITGLTGYYAQGGGTGQSDDIPAMLHDGDFVMDADTVASLGDGSSKAGAEVLEEMRKKVPYRDHQGGHPVPAQIADGEYVFPAAFVTAIGGGSNKVGAERLNEMREKIRAHKRSAPTTKIPPKAKSPLDYLKMAKG
jgi:hypothetical protein